MTQIRCPASVSASRPFAALLLLADGRFPAGGHAHSGGLETAAACGKVHDIPTLEAFLHGRAATAGSMSAAFAAASCSAFGKKAGSACMVEARLFQLDMELEARIPSVALRATSRKLGRQILRALRVVQPDPRLHALTAMFPMGPHQPIVFGAAAASLGLDSYSAALAAVYESATGPATAAIRLLGLNPFEVYAMLARSAAQLDRLAADAAAKAAGPADQLPSHSSPLLDIFAERHAGSKTRLFAS